MRQSLHRLIAAFSLAMLPATLGLFLAGCQTAPDPAFQTYEPWDPDAQIAAPAEESTPAVDQSPTGVPAERREADLSDVLEVGDAVTVTLSGVTTEVVPPHEERIKDNGTINLYLLGAVKAEGRTAGDLQRELQKHYEKYYKNVVVTVNAAQRFYYVGGEVKRPGAQVYLGKTTVTKAIQAAGDFTDFARKGSLQVIRTDGTKMTVNFRKAIREPSLDPPIYPGDKIHVPRRHIW